MSAMEQLRDLCRPIWNLYSIRSLLYWDQQVIMPSRGGSARAEQLASLEAVAHQLLTSPRLFDSLCLAEEHHPQGLDAAYVRAVRRAYDLAAKLPAHLVEEKARVCSRAVEAWVEAKKADRFQDFLPHLREVFRLSREVAEHRGYAQHPYDAMLDEYEPGMTMAEVNRLFSESVPRLVQLVERIQNTPQVSRKILQQAYPVEAQRAFTRYLVEAIGFEFGAGRLDQSAHPFCSSSSAVDVRLTDRLDPHQVTMAIFGSLHEAGHGLYEQGSPPEWMGSPLAGGCSLGVHESQSRLWENFVGRGRPFWKAHFPVLREHFPEQVWGYSSEDFYRAINLVEPSFIRVEADEVTYTLHIVMRFELERDMLDGTLDPADLPEAWNQKMESRLGIRPPNNRLGCLQDIHWSDGLIGYFPTYSLGNLLAAQLWNQVRSELPQLEQEIERGECGALLAWLREKIHRKGSSVWPGEVVQQVCGQPMQVQPFLDYLWGKYTDLYSL